MLLTAYYREGSDSRDSKILGRLADVVSATVATGSKASRKNIGRK